MFEKMEQHADLIGNMAEHTHAGVAESIAHGDTIAVNAWRTAILSCMRCTSSEECRAFLASQPGDCRHAAPDFCRNKSYLDELPEAV